MDRVRSFVVTGVEVLVITVLVFVFLTILTVDVTTPDFSALDPNTLPLDEEVELDVSSNLPIFVVTSSLASGELWSCVFELTGPGGHNG